MDTQMAKGDRPMLIGGELVESESGEWLTSLNPATEEAIGRVPAASKKDVDKAVEAASRAQPEWAALPAGKRGDYLRALADALRSGEFPAGITLANS